MSASTVVLLYSGDLWFSALTHGNSGDLWFQALTHGNSSTVRISSGHFVFFHLRSFDLARARCHQEEDLTQAQGRARLPRTLARQAAWRLWRVADECAECCRSALSDKVRRSRAPLRQQVLPTSEQLVIPRLVLAWLAAALRSSPKYFMAGPLQSPLSQR